LPQVLELMEGGDLSEAIKHDAEGELTWYNKGQRIALDIARGLHYLHSHDVRSPGTSSAAVTCCSRDHNPQSSIPECKC